VWYTDWKEVKMLTHYQVQTGGYVDENYELFCISCFNSTGDLFCRPLSNYDLDEWQTENSRGDGEWCAAVGFIEEWPDEWVCQGCELPLHCAACGGELRGEYDGGCAAYNEREAEADEDPSLD
jgi:hypothetical protein